MTACIKAFLLKLVTSSYKWLAHKQKQDLALIAADTTETPPCPGLLLSSLPQVKILQATGLPRHLSNFVFGQYHFWGQEEPVFIAPEMAACSSSSSSSSDPQCTVVFDSAQVC